MEINKKNQSLEPSGAEKALVCQQAMEIGPLLAKNGFGPLAVVLEKTKSKKGAHFLVTFILVPDKLNIKVQSEGDNLFDVCTNVKNKAKKTVSLLMNQLVDTPSREVRLAYFKKFPYLQ